MEKKLNPDLPAFQQRLLEEYNELKDKLQKITKARNDRDLKMCREEWDMLQAQGRSMREYLSVLERRLLFYGLIDRHSDWIL